MVGDVLLVKYEHIRSKNAKVTEDTRRKKKILPDHFSISPELYTHFARIMDFHQNYGFPKKKKKTNFF